MMQLKNDIPTKMVDAPTLSLVRPDQPTDRHSRRLAPSTTRSGVHRSSELPKSPLRENADAFEVEAILGSALAEPIERFKSTCGKRIRAGMLEQAFRMAGGEGTVPSGVVEAVEMLHGGSLIIDDIQDQSTTRRGQPTMHREIGVPLSINCGNWMYFRAMELLELAEIGEPIRRSIVRATVRCVRRAHEGQAIDLAARVDRLPQTSVRSTASTISRLKTGALAGLSTWIGAACVPADKTVRRALRRFGTGVGICLQMHNDLGELAHLARAGVRADDLRHGRVTWPWAWASRLTTAEEFDAMRAGLADPDGSLESMADLAERLVGLVATAGLKEINRRLDREIRLLGEHVESTASIREVLTKLRTLTV